MISETDLASLIGAIYEAGVDFDRWPETLLLLAAALGGHAASLARQGSTPSDCWSVSARVDPAFQEAYLDHFHMVNPIWRRSATAPAGAVLTDTLVMPRPDFVKTEFFQDFLRPQGIGGMLNCVALVEDGRQTCLAVHSTAEWGPESLALYAVIAPHLQRAFEINIQLGNAEANRLASEALLNRLDDGVLFVDERGRIVFANVAAEGALRDGQGLRQTKGQIAGGSPAETSALHRAIAVATGAAQGAGSGPGSTIRLWRGPARAPLSVRVAPAPANSPQWAGGPRPLAVLTVRDPERQTAPSSAELRSRFGLTPAQAALALEILKGDGIQAAADRMAISRSTARTHLARIFEKTGSQRQSELVRRLLDLRLTAFRD